MKTTPYPPLTRSLAVLPSESPLDHLTRIGDEARQPPKIALHQDATTEPTAAAEISPEQLAELARKSEADGKAAMALLAPKKKTRKT